MADRVLVCVAWPYANGPLHLGHVAGSLLPPDVFARYQRMRGRDVAMVSGSDMHGTPITVAAEKAGEAPEAFAEKHRVLHNRALDALRVKFDLFTSTATANHREVVHELFRTLLANGLIDKRPQTSPYDPKAKRFLPDRYVEGTCPHCAFADARGDQCDNCGRTLDPQELKNPRSKLSGAAPEYRETEHYFLRLDLLQEELSRWIAAQKGPAAWRPSVVNFTEQWLKEGLKPRAITRDLTYGVTIPQDVGDFPEKRIYVWFEAVIGYLSATIEWAKANGRDWRDYWAWDPVHGARHYYFLGKDNIPFHTIIWPGMLLGYDRAPGKLGKLQLPWDVPANEFLQFAGAKFSKSRGNAFYVLDLLEHFDADQVRYYLAANMPERGDTDWTWEDFVAKVNDELADTLGNYVNRVISLSQREFGGSPPDPGMDLDAALAGMPGVVQENARGTASAIEHHLQQAARRLEAAAVKDGLKDVLAIARLGNLRLQEQAPWKHLKEGDAGRARAAAILHWHLRVVKTLAAAAAPYLPDLSEATWTQLGETGPSPRARSERADPGVDHWPRRLLEVPHARPFGDIKPLVRKLDLKAVLGEFQPEKETHPMQKDTTQAHTSTLTHAGGLTADNQPAPNAKPPVSIDDFAKLDLRVARVLSCEPHPKADKLWVLQVDLGTEKRQILAGLREHVKAEELVGKSVIVIANLQPRQIRGLESQGMVLAAEAAGVVAPLMPAKDVPAGAGIK